MTRVQPFIRKELRAVGPLTGACAAVIAVSAWLGGELRGFAMFTYLAGSMAVGSAVVGHELAHVTGRHFARAGSCDGPQRTLGLFAREALCRPRP